MLCANKCSPHWLRCREAETFRQTTELSVQLDTDEDIKASCEEKPRLNRECELWRPKTYRVGSPAELLVSLIVVDLVWRRCDPLSQLGWAEPSHSVCLRPSRPRPASQPSPPPLCWCHANSRVQAQWRAAERNRLCCGTSLSKEDRHVVIVAAGWQVRREKWETLISLRCFGIYVQLRLHQKYKSL